MNLMKSRKILASLCAALLFAVYLLGAAIPQTQAISDVDFTIRPPTEEIAPTESFVVELVINTQTVNGYVSFIYTMTYNEDVLKCTANINDKGFVGGGSNGEFKLTYDDPTGTNTPSEIGEVIIQIPFTVLEGAPGGETAFSATVPEIYGVDEDGKKVVITRAWIKDKSVVIADVAAPQTTSSEEEVSYAGFGEDYSAISVESYIYGYDEDEDMSAGEIFGLIVAAIVIFIAGGAVGYIICQKRMDSSVGRGTYRRGSSAADDDYGDYLPARTERGGYGDDDDYDDDVQGTSYFGRGASRMGGSRYRDDEMDDSFDDDVYADLSGIGRTAPQSSSSMFANVTQPDDDDDDSGFPSAFFPTGYSARREETDDGFGSFSSGSAARRTPSFTPDTTFSDDDDDLRFGGFESFDDDDDDSGFGSSSPRGDRRRFR